MRRGGEGDRGSLKPSSQNTSIPRSPSHFQQGLQALPCQDLILSACAALPLEEQAEGRPLAPRQRVGRLSVALFLWGGQALP